MHIFTQNYMHMYTYSWIEGYHMYVVVVGMYIYMICVIDLQFSMVPVHCCETVPVNQSSTCFMDCSF